jgi:hypothetical protein
MLIVADTILCLLYHLVRLIGSAPICRLVHFGSKSFSVTYILVDMGSKGLVPLQKCLLQQASLNPTFSL